MISHICELKTKSNLILTLLFKPAPLLLPSQSTATPSLQAPWNHSWLHSPLTPYIQYKMEFCWFHLRNVSKCDHISLPSLLQYLGTIISDWDYCNAPPPPNNVYPYFQPLSPHNLFSIQQRNPIKTYHVTPLLKTIQASPISFRVNSKFSFMTYKAQSSLDSCYLLHFLILPPLTPLHSISQLVIPKMFRCAFTSEHPHCLFPLPGIIFPPKICITSSSTFFQS